jgi:fatty acid desaturase
MSLATPDLVADGPATESVRTRIRRDLPADTFAAQPQRALWFVPLVGTVVAGTWAIIAFDPPWYVMLGIALVLGQCYAALGFLAHETLHGSIVSSPRMQTFLGYLGFGAVLVSPTLWRVWHNQVHHGKTNSGDRDPDSFGTIARYERAPSTRYVARLAPGSRRWPSVFFFGYWFAFHGQVVLWIQSRYMKSFRGLDRRRAIIDTASFVAAWGVVAFLAGPFDALFVMVIPMIITNALVMSYIATNHFMRPQTETNDPIENSMSVTTLGLIDKLHFNFSHHVEHHLFPRMSAKHAPRVRTWLEAHAGDRYVTPAHWRALAYLYKTPRVYLDANTLCDPDHPEHRVDIEDVTLALMHRDAARAA